MQEAKSRTNEDATAERAEAFRRLAEGSLHDAYRIAGAILGNPADGRDAVHDGFIKAWQKWPSLRDASKFDAWFKQIVVNTCRERLRQASRRQTSGLSAGANIATPDVAPGSHDRILVNDALLRLKPDDRVVLALRYYRDLKVEDIAAILGLPAGTVKSRLNRAHTNLRAAMERSGSTGGGR